MLQRGFCGEALPDQFVVYVRNLDIRWFPIEDSSRPCFHPAFHGTISVRSHPLKCENACKGHSTGTADQRLEKLARASTLGVGLLSSIAYMQYFTNQKHEVDGFFVATPRVEVVGPLQRNVIPFDSSRFEQLFYMGV